LAWVHARGLMHRDVKPANLLLAPNPYAPRFPLVKLSDFGLACGHAVRGGGGVVERGVGTPGFLPPEYPRWTRKADVWALGVSLHWVCANVLPRAVDEERRTVEWRFVDITAPAASRRRWGSRAVTSVRQYPTELRDVVVGMLKVDDKKRPSSAEMIEIVLNLWDRRKTAKLPRTSHDRVRDLDRVMASVAQIPGA